MSKAFIVAEEISKSYGNTHALDNVSFTAEQDEIIGFIGPDGSGKSTLFEIMTTLLIPDSGKGYINGLDISRDYAKIRASIGYMPGKFSLYPDLSVQENLHFYASIFGSSIQENYDMIKNIYSLLEPFSKRKAGALSGGMKQKLALCCALIHKPLALFLDEPTTGVDPVSRKEFWDNLVQLKEKGIPVVVSTPYMDEAIRCDKVSMIYGGRIMKAGTPESIIEGFKGSLIGISSKDRQKPKQLLQALPGVQSCYHFGDALHVALDDKDTDIRERIRSLLKTKLGDEFTMQPIKPGFEDCFLQLMREHNAG